MEWSGHVDYIHLACEQVHLVMVFAVGSNAETKVCRLHVENTVAAGRCFAHSFAQFENIADLGTADGSHRLGSLISVHLLESAFDSVGLLLTAPTVLLNGTRR